MLKCLHITDIGQQVGEKIQQRFSGTFNPALQAVKLLHQGMISLFYLHGRGQKMQMHWFMFANEHVCFLLWYDGRQNKCRAFFPFFIFSLRIKIERQVLTGQLLPMNITARPNIHAVEKCTDWAFVWSGCFGLARQRADSSAEHN